MYQQYPSSYSSTMSSSLSSSSVVLAIALGLLRIRTAVSTIRSHIIIQIHIHIIVIRQKLQPPPLLLLFHPVIMITRITNSSMFRSSSFRIIVFRIIKLNMRLMFQVWIMSLSYLYFKN